jgi:hypothetical protein
VEECPTIWELSLLLESALHLNLCGSNVIFDWLRSNSGSHLIA